MLKWNNKALAHTVKKLLAGLKFQRGGQNGSVTEWQTGQKQYAADPRSRRHTNRPHVLAAYENYGSSYTLLYTCPYKCMSNAQLCLRLL